VERDGSEKDMQNISLVLDFEDVSAARIESGYFLRPYLKEFVRGVSKVFHGVYLCSSLSPAHVVKSVLARQGVGVNFDGVFGVDDIQRDVGMIERGLPPVRTQKLLGDPFLLLRDYFSEWPILKQVAFFGFDVMELAKSYQAKGVNQHVADCLNDLDDRLYGCYSYLREEEIYRGGLDDGYFLEKRDQYLASYDAALKRSAS
jgi:hypothetical protein